MSLQRKFKIGDIVVPSPKWVENARRVLNSDKLRREKAVVIEVKEDLPYVRIRYIEGAAKNANDLWNKDNLIFAKEHYLNAFEDAI